MRREPEEDFGNIEYKTKLIDKDMSRIESLATQMRFRCDEGHGEAIYVIGITDSGKNVGLEEKEFEESFLNLSKAAKMNKYTLSILSKKSVDKKKYIYELLIREKNDSKYIDIKVAVAGQVDSGKSTLISVLTRGKNDDGRGSARLSIFNFRHEIVSGRTSSIAQHILGFDDKGNIINYLNSRDMHKKSWPEIVRESSKIVSFFDLCGHEKYLKTTIRGITSTFPDVCFIIIGGNMGVSRTTREHIFLCTTLHIPFCIIVSKIDICKNRKKVFRETIRQIKSLLKLPGISRVPYKINTKDDVILSCKNIDTESIAPIFYVSNVTGYGLDLVKTFLNLTKKTINNKGPNLDKVELYIDTTFWVHGVGTVVGGQLLSGVIKIGDQLLLGPNQGKYVKVQVKSIHCKRVPMEEVICGRYVCLALKKIDRKNIRRGNVIIGLKGKQRAVWEFDADVTVLKSHSTTIRPNYEPLIHTRSIRQTAKLIEISSKSDARITSKNIGKQILRTGDKGRVKFRFLYRAEYIKPGYKILMAEGRVKIVGVIKNIFEK
jgi:GTPase